jgi:hypothetical protein
MVIVGVTISTRLRECSTSPVWDLSISQASLEPCLPTRLSNIVIVPITLYYCQFYQRTWFWADPMLFGVETVAKECGMGRSDWLYR